MFLFVHEECEWLIMYIIGREILEKMFKFMVVFFSDSRQYFASGTACFMKDQK